jgi:uncharacterized hydantoinase/oxoprolinase family protein
MKRKPQRHISEAYNNVIKPQSISEHYWLIWKRYNEGLNTVELAMEFKTKKHEVTQIISNVVEKLKNKPKLVDDFCEDFKSVDAAMEYRNRLRNSYYMAYRKAKKEKSKNILIMSEI